MDVHYNPQRKWNTTRNFLRIPQGVTQRLVNIAARLLISTESDIGLTENSEFLKKGFRNWLIRGGSANGLQWDVNQGNVPRNKSLSRMPRCKYPSCLMAKSTRSLNVSPVRKARKYRNRRKKIRAKKVVLVNKSIQTEAELWHAHAGSLMPENPQASGVKTPLQFQDSTFIEGGGFQYFDSFSHTLVSAEKEVMTEVPRCTTRESQTESHMPSSKDCNCKVSAAKKEASEVTMSFSEDPSRSLQSSGYCSVTNASVQTSFDETAHRSKRRVPLCDQETSCVFSSFDSDASSNVSRRGEKACKVATEKGCGDVMRTLTNLGDISSGDSNLCPDSSNTSDGPKQSSISLPSVDRVQSSFAEGLSIEARPESEDNAPMSPEVVPFVKETQFSQNFIEKGPFLNCSRQERKTCISSSQSESPGKSTICAKSSTSDGAYSSTGVSVNGSCSSGSDSDDERSLTMSSGSAVSGESSFKETDGSASDDDGTSCTSEEEDDGGDDLTDESENEDIVVARKILLGPDTVTGTDDKVKKRELRRLQPEQTAGSQNTGVVAMQSCLDLSDIGSLSVVPNAHLAARNGDLNTLRQLIKENKNVMETVDEKGWTTLHLASFFGLTDVIEVLIQEGSDLCALDPSGYTAFHISAMNGHSEVLKIFIHQKIEVDFTTADGFTALHLAALNNHLNCCKILLCSGASMEVTDKLGRSVIQIAEEHSDASIKKFLGNMEDNLSRFYHLVQVFAEVGSRPTKSSSEGLPQNVLEMLSDLAEDENPAD